MDLSDKCLFSGVTDGLDTKMTVTVDGEKYQIALSEEFEEKSIKEMRERVREVVLERRNADEAREKEIADLREKAKALGIQLVLEGDQEMNLVKKEEPEPEPEPKKEAPGGWGASVSPEAYAGDALRIQAPQRSRPDAPKARPHTQRPIDAPTSIDSESINNVPAEYKGKVRANARLEKHSSYQMQQVQTVDGATYRPPKAEVLQEQFIRGRGGRPTPIPAHLHGETGDTVIKYVEVNDRDIQMHAKEFADRTMKGDGDVAVEYNERTIMCRACNGTGVARIGNQACPKCGGLGILT